MSAVVPLDFDSLMRVHPDYIDIRKRLTIPKYIDETCAVQMSYALNKAGAPVLHFAYADPGLNNGHVNAYKDAKDGCYYIFAVPDMKVYLNNTYGEADNYKGTKQQMMDSIAGRTGILSFGNRHIDIWKNDSYQWQGHYIDLWVEASAKQRGIFFWEMSPTGDN